jgi:hypothetical protein
MSMPIGTRRFANAFVGAELLEPGPLAVVENPYQTCGSTARFTTAASWAASHKGEGFQTVRRIHRWTY